MKGNLIGIAAASLCAFVVAAVIACFCLFNPISPTFQRFSIDSRNPARITIVDIDGDSMPDIFAAVDYEALKPIGLYWYAYPSWTRHTIEEGVNFRGDDLEAGDMDNDGDSDLVVTVNENGKVFWYENPRPQGDPKTSTWAAHRIGVNGSYVKDVEVGDLDDNSYLDVVTRGQEEVNVFTQISGGTWARVRIPIHKKEGMDIGDLDGDGDMDIAFNGYWLESPPDLLTGNWVEHTIDPKWHTQDSGKWQDNCSNVAIADMNQDGKEDVLLCHSEKPNWPISWYEATHSQEGPWVEHVIAEKYNYCETLETADTDDDGDLDVVAGEMKKSFRHGDVTIFVNTGGALTWAEEPLARRLGIYDGQVADIGRDGDFDIIGCRDYNQPPLYWWENTTNDERFWTYKAIDQNRPESQFGKMGLVFSDINLDGWTDVVAGSFLYINPGGQLSDPWPRVSLPENIDVYFSIEVDSDGHSDLVGISKNQILWLESANREGTDWIVHTIGVVPEGRTQGYTQAQIIPGGKDELVFTRARNLFYIEIPETHPEKTHWRKVHVSAHNEEEGIAAGDIDRDGDNDLAAYDADGHHVIWFENPGDGSGLWQRRIVGTSDEWLDRIALVDVNNDGRLDIVSTEETQDWVYNANIYWFKSPIEPKEGDWTRHVVATLRSVNSMDTGDVDKDGDVDIVVAEHTDQKSRPGAADNFTIIFENRHDGAVWTPHVVERGTHSSHLGAKLCDLDKDGDTEIVSIAWRQYDTVHLWRRLPPGDHGIEPTDTIFPPQTQGVLVEPNDADPGAQRSKTFTNITKQ
ncbi:MAG: VCBS repeat-containing protein [Thermodesulfobacteriota bacterium]|nr:VCBS repeat-containing protein [Thermodesulfobacteriota bacterium]